MTLGEKIKNARKQAGLSQEQLAEKVGVSRSAVAKWESNNGLPDIDNLKNLSYLLGVTIDYLVKDGETADDIIVEKSADESNGEVKKNDDDIAVSEGIDRNGAKQEPTPEKHTPNDRADNIFPAILIICIISAVALLGGYIFNDATVQNMKTYTVDSEITDLYIDIGAADIIIKQGEAFSVKSNLKYLTVNDEKGFLVIKETKIPFVNYTDATLIITIPTDTVFESAELNIGAGKLTADTLSAKVLDCDFGAGEVKINSLSASSSAEIDGGSGKITITGGSINDLDFDMGVGELIFASRLTGKCDLALGVGESNITLIGSEDDYTVDIEKGIGSIAVDGSNIPNTPGFGSGANRVKLTGGIGTINVRFKGIN